MKYAVVALALVAFAGSAAAAEEVTDVDFLKANRCKGLATSIEGVVDPAALTSFIKAERVAALDDVGGARARKEARSQDRKARLTAELTGACQAYLGAGTNVAKKADGVSKQ